MIGIEEIRLDLSEVRYYYTRKQVLDEAQRRVGTNAITGKVQRYNAAMREAPPQIYDLYISLYTKNYTQEGLSIEWNYTVQYIQRLNKRLLEYLQARLE